MNTLNRSSFAGLGPSVPNPSCLKTAFNVPICIFPIIPGVVGNPGIGVLSLGLTSAVRASVEVVRSELEIRAALL
jgi:hypothetical protein